jgi:hypothetical protein
MPKQTVERVFTRRSFLLFLFLAPAAVLTLVAIILATQYKQLQSVVSSLQAVTPFEWNSAGRARLDSVLVSVQNFSSGSGSDTLVLPAPDLNLLAAASPVLQKQRLYFRFTDTDTLLFVETTQSIEDQNRKLSWILKKIVPLEFQYLNAQLEGLPQWKEGKLEFIPERGYLNGSKVPRAALSKRSGMAVRDFIEDSGMPVYDKLRSVLDTTFYTPGGVTLVRRSAAADSAF